RRIDDVGVAHGVDDLLQCDAARVESFRINRNVILARLSAGNRNLGNSWESRQARTNRKARQFAQGLRVALVGGEAVTGDREDGKGQTINAANGSGRRQAGGQLRKPRLNKLQRLQYVNVPVEEEIDVSAAALCRRTNALNARYAVHRFFNGPG